jgi:1-hydroxycarotenoid 3,4-desaturase
MLPSPHVAIAGAGIGGLAAAVELAARGWQVTLLERQASVGGKMRQIRLGEAAVDAGPTVLTLPGVLEDLFKTAGTSLADQVALQRAEVLARHAWPDGSRLDLYADSQRSAEAIAAFANRAEAQRYLAFCDRAARIFRTLEQPFMRAPRPSMPELVSRVGLHRIGDLWRIAPFTTLWRALGGYFRDPRLQQLFGRYATYCGSSPFQAPATLMLIAHAEREGVWLVEGGMQRIATAMASVARTQGAVLRCSAEVAQVITDKRGQARAVMLTSGERLEADAVLLNADLAATAAGRFGAAAAKAVPAQAGAERSLSALTWVMLARAEGFPLQRHNVFFSADYAAEFEALRQRRVPLDPTVYICAQQREQAGAQAPDGDEPLLCLINAPADGDTHDYSLQEIADCAERMRRTLDRAGLRLNWSETVATAPCGFERLFPGTGGALYGRASHGWQASFARSGSRTRMRGLYLAGGSVHPGAGVPMAVLSGRLAAASIIADHGAPR